MAGDATSIYWATAATSQIWACLKDACKGGPRKITTVTGTTYYVSVDANNVYFNSNSGDAMYRAPIDGSTPATLLTTVNAPTRNVVDEGYVYWSGNGGDARRIAVTAVAGTPAPELLASGLPDPGGVAVYGSTFYVADRGSGSVYSLPKIGGAPPAEIMKGLSAPVAIAVDDSGVYVGTADGKIARYANGMQTTFASGAGPVGHKLVLTKDDVFWTVTAPSGAVMTAPKSTGVARPLATNQANPQSIVVDDSAVYWSNEADSTIQMIVR
jgi:hypothetical protein